MSFDDPFTHGVSASAGSLVEDFNNVLSVITGNLALAERHAAGNARLIRLLNNMRLATERGGTLAQQLVAMVPGRDTGFGPIGFAEEPATFGDATPATRRILVVEDDPLVAEVAVTVLSDMGHTVTLRHDGPSALTVLQEAAFDLVFSDIVMPGGMSGIEMAEQIAASTPHLPILLATGYSNAALAPGALRFPVLAKPYSVHELTRRVSQMLPA